MGILNRIMDDKHIQVGDIFWDGDEYEKITWMLFDDNYILRGIERERFFEARSRLTVWTVLRIAPIKNVWRDSYAAPDMTKWKIKGEVKELSLKGEKCRRYVLFCRGDNRTHLDEPEKNFFLKSDRDFKRIRKILATEA